jgi:hypothetical protein
MYGGQILVDSMMGSGLDGGWWIGCGQRIRLWMDWMVDSELDGG